MNKPVAWMETYKGEPNNLDWDKNNLNYGSEFHDVVPLYNHPANLTSLEIADAMELVFGEQIEEQFGNDLEEFARAILKKAQEK